MPDIIYLEHTSSVLRDNPLGDPHVRRLPVYLPPGYHDAPDRRYPVIWVLAPFTSWGERMFNLQAWDENIVQRMDRLVRSGQAEPAILAFPDAFTMFGGSQYVNSSAVGRYQDYLLEELVPFLDENVRTLASPEHRAVLGYSSGGFAALRLSMCCPGVFSAAASHAGDMWFEACYWPDIPGAVRGLAQAGGVEPFVESLRGLTHARDTSRDWFSTLGMVAMSACYSPNPKSPAGFDLPFDPVTGEIDAAVWARWQTYDPLRLAADHIEALRSLKALYFDCGVYDEYNLFLGARRLHRLLDEHGVDHIYQEFSGGHRNINWRYDVSLPIISRAIARREG